MKNNSQYKKADFRRHAADFRDDSHRYVSIALREMSIYDKASIEFPTGTGKTRIIHCDLLRFLPDSGNDVFCIASHRLMLNVQHIKGLLGILKHAIPDVAFIFVGSQPIDFSQITKGNKSLANEIIALLATYNEPLDDCDKILPDELIQQTCSSIELKSMIEVHKEKGRDVIIISTYHSLEKLAGIPLHTIYCDEAHMIAGPHQTEFMKSFETLTAERQYFFTGTPKEALKQNANKLICGEDEEHAIRFDRLMDNKEIFGERIKLTIKEAINATLIVQPIWHILYPDNIESVDRSDDIKSRGRMLQQCFKSHEKWLMGETADATKIAPKILVNCKGVEDIWKLEKEIRETFNTYKGKPIRIFGIASAGSGEDDDAAMMIDGKGIISRIDFLTELNELKDDEYAIIFHFNVLTEGIDVPSMTGVVFMTTTLPTIIKTLQTIGRATRLHPGDRKRLFGSTDMNGTDRMTLADRDTKWIKPYCAVMIPVLGDETNLMSATMKAMIPELADSVDFENRLLLSVGEDTAIGKTIFENPNELRTGLECSVAKPLFDIKEIYEEIQKTREIEYNNAENAKLTTIFDENDDMNELIDKLIEYAK